MLAAVRCLIHGLLADPPACPRCASADAKRSRRPSRWSAVGLVRCRCRACGSRFYLSESQAARLPERVEDVTGRPENGPRTRRRDTAEPVDLEAIERQIAQARAAFHARGRGERS